MTETELREVAQRVLDELRREMPSVTEAQRAFHIGATEAVNMMCCLVFDRVRQ